MQDLYVLAITFFIALAVLTVFAFAMLRQKRRLIAGTTATMVSAFTGEIAVSGSTGGEPSSHGGHGDAHGHGDGGHGGH